MSQKFYSFWKFLPAESHVIIETSQLIFVCEFTFALLDFRLGEFLDKIKNDLFAVFHYGLEISKKIFGKVV